MGGNSKVYGAALFRLRDRDFGEVVHAGGVSRAWPLGYDVFVNPTLTIIANALRVADHIGQRLK